jgi:hypothetical protein
MSNMTQNDRNQFSRYDLQERRSSMTELSERGAKVLAILTLVFIGVLAALTFAAVQVFDGMHHLIIIADIVLVVLAIAFWINSTRQPEELEAETPFVPKGLRPTEKR